MIRMVAKIGRSGKVVKDPVINAKLVLWCLRASLSVCPKCDLWKGMRCTDLFNAVKSIPKTCTFHSRKHVCFSENTYVFFKGSSDSIFLCTFACYKELLRNYLWQKKTTNSRSKIIQSESAAALKIFKWTDPFHYRFDYLYSTICVGLALISFFFTGAADQSKENVPLGDLLINRGSWELDGCTRGAYLSDLLMNRWFGISLWSSFLGIGWGETHELK